MQLVYHLGAHCTDEDRILKCLLKNKGALAKQGILVPGPSRYKNVLRETMRTLNGRPADAQTQHDILTAVMDEDSADRLVFSQQSFLSAPARVLEMNLIYAQAGEKSASLSNLFPDAQTEFHIALRNPATFIPALFARVNDTDFPTFVSVVDPRALRWSDTVARIRSANPKAKVTVWCNEDTPLIWPEVLRAIGGHSPETVMEGELDFLATIMTKPGMARLRAYLDQHPPQNEVQRRRVVAAFLDKFALEDEIEMELDLPGWTEDLIEELTEIYEEDVFEIERMAGVTFLAP